jgi:hypothetical protein
MGSSATMPRVYKHREHIYNIIADAQIKARKHKEREEDRRAACVIITTRKPARYIDCFINLNCSKRRVRLVEQAKRESAFHLTDHKLGACSAPSIRKF